jgi:hypothetical protein
MQNSGLVDFQSHSYSHHTDINNLHIKSVWIKSRQNDIPWAVPGFDIRTDRREIRLLPVFDGSPLYGGGGAYLLPDSFWSQCYNLQKKHEAHITGKLDHRKVEELKNEYGELLKGYSLSDCKMQANDIEDIMRKDLEDSRSAIECELPATRINHFSFPWHSSSPASWKVLMEGGFISGAVGLNIRDEAKSADPSVATFFRVNADFLFCLPGTGRRSFLYSIFRKILRRMNRANTYGLEY